MESEHGKRISRRQLIFLFTCAALYLVCSTLLYFAVPTASMRLEIDSPAYLEKAQNILTYGSIEPPGKIGCSSWVGSGYSFFLAGLALHFDFIIWIQILLGLGILLCTFLIAQRLFNTTVGCIAVSLASINLGLIVFPQFILTETLICFLSILALERFSCWLYTNNNKAIFFSGFIYGVSIIVKASGWYFFWLLSLVVCFLSYQRKNGLIPPILFIAAFTAPVITYGLYNKKVYGHFFVKAVDKVNLYYLYVPQLLMETRGISKSEAVQMVGELVEVKEFASGEGWEKVNSLFINEVLWHPLAAIKVALINIDKTLFGLYSNHLKLLFTSERKIEGVSFFHHPGSLWEKTIHYIYSDSRWWISLIGFIELFMQFIKYMALFGCFIVLLMTRQWIPLLFLGGWIGYYVGITFPEGCARLRFLAEMPMILGEAYFIYFLPIFIKNGKKHSNNWN